ncbi:hypothetical protein DFP72DRAFT_1080757 [Ephemerocybe angulata]|uniref:Uncharacterized protein n=1 Tax=Ephemerocybe angulata TaxID=980116 RepID=A0A8H6HA28_9AGAR|nr:hypothetical protein DFP72DRAFT_1080757 [Tulosesus angulatus]
MPVPLDLAIALPPMALFLSIAFLYSQFNSRSTEDCTHPLWNLVMYVLCEKYMDRLLPTPQFRLWRFKTEAPGEIEVEDGPEDVENFFDENGECPGDSSISSIKTVAAKIGTIYEVIADYAILMPILRFRFKLVDERFRWIEEVPGIKEMLENPSQTAKAILDALNFIFPIWTVARVSKLTVPLLAELKSPISRHPKSVGDQKEEIDSALNKAKEQVSLQARYIPLAKKFAHQDEILLVAATGDFWAFCCLTRASDEQKREAERLDKELERERRAAFKKARALRGKAEEEEKEKAAEEPIFDKERYVVLSRKEGDEDTNEEKLDDIPSEADPTVSTLPGRKSIYSVDELNAHWKKANPAASSKQLDWIATKPIALSHEAVLKFGETFEVFNGWSPVLKIGTRASNEALMFMRQELRNLATKG